MQMTLAGVLLRPESFIFVGYLELVKIKGGTMKKTIVEDTSAEPERELTTYFDPKRMLGICSLCDLISKLALGLAALILILGIWILSQSVTPTASFARLVMEAGPLALIFAFFTLLCLFFWIFLRAVSEGLYILMDIQDNTDPNREEK
jgi:hypothetical protein